MNEHLDPLAISVQETAWLLSLSKPKVYDLINRSDFPAFKLGGRTLVNVEGLRLWVNNQTAGNDNVHELRS